MSGSSIEGLGLPAKRYRPSRCARNFETKKEARKEDRLRARRLRREASSGKFSSYVAKTMIILADALERKGILGTRSPVPTTMASKQRMRRLRNRVLGHLWALIARLDSNVHFFTLIPVKGDITTDQLANFDPRKLKQQLRSGLIQGKAAGTSGILFCVLEAEFQSNTEVWRFHWHGIASDGMLKAVHNLRSTRAFKSPRRKAGEPKQDVAYRVRVSKKPLHHLPNPLTYCLKHWVACWTDKNGKRSRKFRPQDPALVNALLWLGRWRPTDLILMMGLRITRSGFGTNKSTPMDV